jgi:EpsI family protein
MEEMEKRTHKHCIVVICLLVAAGLALELMPDTPEVVEADIRTELPAQLNSYTGQTRVFCQNDECLRNFVITDAADTVKCPICGSATDPTSFAEKSTLPADTVVLKREYIRAGGNLTGVSVVFSGTDQRSIHRPQQCLPAQGWSMERERTIIIPIEGQSPLRVRLIDVRANQRPDMTAGFAYWFVGRGHETPSHLERLFWMSADRVLHNRAQKWAYVAIMTGYGNDPERDVAELKNFISELYPQLKK